MAADTRTRLTPEQYLALERASEIRSEYRDGEMIAIPRSSIDHSQIATNVLYQLGMQLRGGPCSVLSGAMRIGVPATGLYTYADVVVLCDEPALADEFCDTLTNPTLLIEVMSPSTEVYDRTTKFEHYRALDSLRAYLLVAQDRPRVEQFVRQSGGDWTSTTVTSLADRIVLPAIGCHLAMAEIYDHVRCVGSPTGTANEGPKTAGPGVRDSAG